MTFLTPDNCFYNHSCNQLSKYMAMSPSKTMFGPVVIKIADIVIIIVVVVPYSSSIVSQPVLTDHQLKQMEDLFAHDPVCPTK